MKLEPFILLVVCRSGDADWTVNGEVIFDLKLPGSALNQSVDTLREEFTEEVTGEKAVFKATKKPGTAGPVVECIYQYPENEQIDAILSNMMNELTKVFVRAHDFFSDDKKHQKETDDELKHKVHTNKDGIHLTGGNDESGHLTDTNEETKYQAENSEDGRHRAVTDEEHKNQFENITEVKHLVLSDEEKINLTQTNGEENRPLTESKEDKRQLPDTRFRVVNEKKTQFFEHIYHNMTKEYSQFYNSTTQRVERSGRDPCQYQAEIKQLWRSLLDKSLATFRQAALRCVEEHLRIQKYDERTRNQLGQFLMRELAKVRTNHLQLLCDHFQLCFNDLQ